MKIEHNKQPDLITVRGVSWEVDRNGAEIRVWRVNGYGSLGPLAFQTRMGYMPDLIKALNAIQNEPERT